MANSRILNSVISRIDDVTKNGCPYIKLLISMDSRLSELPNRISTQDLTHRSSGDINGQSQSLLARNLPEIVYVKYVQSTKG